MLTKRKVGCKWTDGKWKTTKGKKHIVPTDDNYREFEAEIEAHSIKQAMFLLAQEICKTHGRKTVFICNTFVSRPSVEQLELFKEAE